MLKYLLLALAVAILGSITILSNSNQTSAPLEQTKIVDQDNIIVQSNGVESSVASGLANRVEDSWPWYTTRASGLVAAGSLLILMLSGIGMITGRTFSFLEPITAWATHRALGIAFTIATIIHVAVLYFDSFVPFDVASLLLPFRSEYETVSLLGLPATSWYVTAGIISLYTIIAIMVTSIFWVQKFPKLWKITHILSYLALILVFVHALYLGTDFSGGILRIGWICLAFILMLASIFRLRRANTE